MVESREEFDVWSPRASHQAISSLRKCQLNTSTMTTAVAQGARLRQSSVASRKGCLLFENEKPKHPEGRWW
jgi:hypothetical protein